MSFKSSEIMMVWHVSVFEKKCLWISLLLSNSIFQKNAYFNVFHPKCLKVQQTECSLGIFCEKNPSNSSLHMVQVQSFVPRHPSRVHDFTAALAKGFKAVGFCQPGAVDATRSVEIPCFSNINWYFEIINANKKQLEVDKWWESAAILDCSSRDGFTSPVKKWREMPRREPMNSEMTFQCRWHSWLHVRLQNTSFTNLNSDKYWRFPWSWSTIYSKVRVKLL